MKLGFKSHAAELIKYIINGLIATAVHYSVLRFNIEKLHFHSAAEANMVAAVLGIFVSFLGSRYFVFCKDNEPIKGQAIRFAFLYSSIACLHGLVLLIWTDWFGLNYKLGFLIATVLQVSISYLGNKFLVFKT
jgi:putative flippase GtrA